MGLLSRAVRVFIFHIKKYMFFLVNTPVAALASPITIVVGRVFEVLVMFLPLKILILLASTGVPSKLKFLIPQDEKDKWIIILCILICISYLMAIIFNLVSKRIIHNTALKIINKNPDKNIKNYTGKKRKLIKEIDNMYRGYGDLLMISLAGVLLFVLNTVLFTFIVFLLLTQILITSYLVDSSSGKFEWIRIRIVKNYRLYLKNLESLNFMLLFFALVLYHIFYKQLDIIIAVIILLLGRRAMPSFKQYVLRLIYLDKRSQNIRELLNK